MMHVSTVLFFLWAARWQRTEETAARSVGSNLWISAKFFMQRWIGRVWILICFAYADLLSGYLAAIRLGSSLGWCNATVRATRWAIRDAGSQHNRFGALQKNNGNWV